MSDQETRLREQLQRMADEADAPPAMPKPTMRRASRGALTTLFASLGTVAVIAVGVVVGVRAFTAGTPERIPESVGPTGGTGATTAPSTAPATVHGKVTAVDFVDDQHGWMVDADGILATSDGGATWTRQLSAHASMASLYFLDPTHGWAAGVDGVFSMTDGSTWTKLSDEQLQGPYFVSSTKGWAIALPGAPRLLRTTDGGQTWTPDPAGIGFESVCFTDPSTGYAGMKGTVLKTTDEGSTWQTISQVPGNWGASQLECPAPNTVWALFVGEGAAGTLDYAAFRSTDGAATWTAELTSPLEDNNSAFNGVPTISNYPGPFAATSASDAVFFGYCPACSPASVVMLTSDGTTWQRSTIDGFLPQHVSFADSEHGWLVAQQGFQGNDVVLATSDGGATWGQVYP
jgi:photosystem II stability/assembly factor-like uncharacterized protein